MTLLQIIGCAAFVSLITSPLAANPQQFAKGKWTVQHTKDAFEDIYKISFIEATAAGNLFLNCETGKSFSMSMLGTHFPAKQHNAVVLVEGDDKFPPVTLMTDVIVPGWLDVNDARPAERLLLTAHKVGVRIKGGTQRDQDLFFDMPDSSNVRSLVLQVCRAL